jgi:hypothetical protein
LPQAILLFLQGMSAKPVTRLSAVFRDMTAQCSPEVRVKSMHSCVSDGQTPLVVVVLAKLDWLWLAWCVVL